MPVSFILKIYFNILEEDQRKFSSRNPNNIFVIVSHPQQHFDTQIMADSAEKFRYEFPSSANSQNPLGPLYVHMKVESW